MSSIRDEKLAIEELRFRKITLEDKNDILVWRNDPVSVANSLTTKSVSQQQHDEWFNKVINDESRVYLMALIDDRKIGFVRYDLISDGKYEVSINVSPDFRGRGLGAIVLKESLKFVKGHVIARIKKANQHSVNAFEKAGYRLNKSDDQIFIYEIYIS